MKGGIYAHFVHADLGGNEKGNDGHKSDPPRGNDAEKEHVAVTTSGGGDVTVQKSSDNSSDNSSDADDDKSEGGNGEGDHGGEKRALPHIGLLSIHRAHMQFPKKVMTHTSSSVYYPLSAK